MTPEQHAILRAIDYLGLLMAREAFNTSSDIVDRLDFLVNYLFHALPRMDADKHNFDY